MQLCSRKTQHKMMLKHGRMLTQSNGAVMPLMRGCRVNTPATIRFVALNIFFVILTIKHTRTPVIRIVIGTVWIVQQAAE
jgi:hypothetical protein